MANCEFFLESWGRFVPSHLSIRELDALLTSYRDQQRIIVGGVRSDMDKLERINIDIQTLEMAIQARKRRGPKPKTTIKNTKKTKKTKKKARGKSATRSRRKTRKS